MSKVVAKVQVRAGADQAFSAMIELRSQDRWIIATKLFPLAGGPAVPAVGSRIAALTGLAGFGVLDTMEVTVFDPPHRWETRHTGKFVRGTGVFAVEPKADGVEISWAEELDLPFGLLGRLGWVVAGPAVRFGLTLSLRRLAAGIIDGSLPPIADAT